jgi:phosphoribosylaminoimidazole-succinocarboxamide synthase
MPGAERAARGRIRHMRRVYVGKTKDVFTTDDGKMLLLFKDSVTGADGKIDSGANEVIGEVAGKGNSSFRLTLHFFELIKAAGIPTHFVSEGPLPNSMVVRAARSYGLEVVCRLRAWGSFVKRYGKYIEHGAPLPSLVEFTIKDDQAGDPLINSEAMVVLGIANAEAVDFMTRATRQITALIAEDLASRDLELIDIKYEFGEVDGQTVLIDEVSGDSMRVARHGRVLLQNELAEAVLG